VNRADFPSVRVTASGDILLPLVCHFTFACILWNKISQKALNEMGILIMKKTKVFRIVLAISVLTFTAISLTGCGAKTFNPNSFNPNNVTKVELLNGTDGNWFEIIDSDDIQTLLRFFNGNSFTKGKSSSDSTGWRYRLKFYNYDNLLEEITVMTETQIAYEGYFYQADNDCIDTAFLNELLATTIRYDWGHAKTASVQHVLSGQITESTIIDKQQIDGLAEWYGGLSLAQRQFAAGESPGDMDGGEEYTFTLDNNSESFSYIISGPDDCYIFLQKKWFLVNNPSRPFGE
jgi:hypothetical protein